MKAAITNIPNELKRLRNWVCWAGDKIPKNPRTGNGAMSNNPETWSDFETAVKAVDKFKFSGIGFMLSEPYFGVDIDHCFDNQDLIDEFVEGLQSYTEISQSGNGIHILCRGKLPDGARRRNNIEMYDSGRYFIMTGNLYNERYTEIRDRSEEIKILHQKYLYTPTVVASPGAFQKISQTDTEVIDKALASLSGSTFSLLYSGQWQGLPYPSQSEADLAFCGHLAFWTQKDEAQMDRIFRSSGMYRPKWDEKRGALTYGQITINKAIDSCVDVYQPRYGQDDTKLAVRFFADGSVGAKVGRDYDMTDSGNAQRMFDLHGKKLHYNYAKKKWSFWDDRVWTWDETGYVKRLADNVVEELKREASKEPDEKLREKKLKFAARTANTNGKTAMIKELEHIEGIPVLLDDFDCDAGLLNCQNGIVDLSNGELKEHDPNALMSRICLPEFDPFANEPKRWLQFLDEITNGDKELQRYLQKCVGYSLTGSIREQCVFFLYGLGNNGKSTFLDVITNLLGSYAANVQPESIMVRKFGNGAGQDIARLKGVRFAMLEEATEGAQLNEGLLKQLSGGSKVTCRFLYGEEFEYTPEFKLWLATNHKPVIHGTDSGIWRRIRLIPFEVNIPADKVDKKLKHKLLEESKGILKWMVDGAIAYEKEGLDPPECVKRSTEEYRSEMDLIAAFVDACIEIDYNSTELIPANQVYAIYQRWAKDHNEYEMKTRRFYSELKKKIPTQKRIASGVVYEHITLTPYAEQYTNAYSSAMFYND